MNEPGVPRRSPKKLDAAILLALAGGSLMKWQLRTLLHEPETFVLQRLKALKSAGHVVVVGKTLDQRGWALASTPPRRAAIKASDTHKGRRCEQCHYRWAQHRGLCRMCERAIGRLAQTSAEVEAGRRAQAAARIEALRPPAPTPREVREVTIGRETFFVIWDGS